MVKNSELKEQPTLYCRSNMNYHIIDIANVPCVISTWLMCELVVIEEKNYNNYCSFFLNIICHVIYPWPEDLYVYNFLI